MGCWLLFWKLIYPRVDSQLCPQTFLTILSLDLVTASFAPSLPPWLFKVASNVFKPLAASQPLWETILLAPASCWPSILLIIRGKSLDSGAELVIIDPLPVAGNQIYCSLYSHHFWRVLPLLYECDDLWMQNLLSPDTLPRPHQDSCTQQPVGVPCTDSLSAISEISESQEGSTWGRLCTVLPSHMAPTMSWVSNVH